MKNMKISGINSEEVMEEMDITDNDGNFTGYHKRILIKDYVLIVGDNTKQPNLVKQISVEISYKLAGKDKNVKISTYIKKE